MEGGSFHYSNTFFTCRSSNKIIGGSLKHCWVATDIISTRGQNFLAINCWCLILSTRSEGVKPESSGIIPIDYQQVSPINIL